MPALVGPRPEFIIWAPSYDETVGGIIALHLLCDRLNKLGFSSALWPLDKPNTWKIMGRHALRSHLSYFLRRKKKFRTGPFTKRIARYRDLKAAVVVYPEIIAGNPLAGSKVVRWFLHKPGFHTGQIEYGPNELYFFYNQAFNDPSLNADNTNLLHLTYINPVYKQTNFGRRSGSCYLIRKGNGRMLNQHPPDSILVDDMSHEEKASLFNRVERFYSYDLYTFYTVYASICGCIPIIIPEEGKTKEDWEPSLDQRLGRAYGTADEDWAVATRTALINLLNQNSEKEDHLVRDFVRKCREFFG